MHETFALCNMNSTQLEIAHYCDKIKQLLLSKNAKYGDSALNPCRVFSKANAVEQILVRIDDKLNRIQKGAGLLASDEDVIQDLIGYLVLLQIAQERQKPPESLESIYKEVLKDQLYSGNNSYDRWDGVDIEPKYSNGNHLMGSCKASDGLLDGHHLQIMGERSPD